MTELGLCSLVVLVEEVRFSVVLVVLVAGVLDPLRSIYWICHLVEPTLCTDGIEENDATKIQGRDSLLTTSAKQQKDISYRISSNKRIRA